MVLRATASVPRARVAPHLRPHQFGVGVKGGTERLHHVLFAHLAAQRSHGLLSIDRRNAFISINRDKVLEAAEAVCPELGGVARLWLPARQWHWARCADGSSARIEATRGVEQGCPLSPVLFATAVRDALRGVESEVRRWPGCVRGGSRLFGRHVPRLAPAALPGRVAAAGGSSRSWE